MASCFALITTAFAFAIRAGIMNDLSSAFSLSDTQLGWINFMGAFGFPIATLVGGPLYNGDENIAFMFEAVLALSISLAVFGNC